MTRSGPEQHALRLVQAFLVAVLALSLFIALVVPYHATDALVYGQFSRLIGREGGFLFDQVGYPAYSRPLFYAPQGWLWWAFGQHDWIGRLVSLGFFGLLLWSVHRLARDRSLPPVAPWLAVLLLFACPDVVVQAFAGQTDVPVAALIALAGVLLWRYPPAPRTAALIVLVAAAAVLAKATSLPALAGLGLATLIGTRAGLVRRVLYGGLPLAVGTGLGLLYGVVMAHHFGLALNEFLGGAVTQPAEPAAGGGGGEAVGTSVGAAAQTSAATRVGSAVSQFTDSERPSILLRAEWFGPYLRILVIFALVYAVARVVKVPHRLSVFGALAAAVAWYLLGPLGSVMDTGAGAVLGSLLLVAALAAIAWCPPELRASRLLLARLLAWGLPPLIAWGLFGILGDTRTLSPAWPALFVLVGGVAAMGVAGLRTRSAWAPAAAIVLLLGLAVLDFRNYDGLGARPDGTVNSTRALRELTPSTWLNPEKARIAADSQLGGLVADVDKVRGAHGRVLTNDGRLGYYWFEDATVAQPPQRCSDLRGYRVLALLQNVPEPFDASAFDCLRPVREVPGSYAVYAVAR